MARVPAQEAAWPVAQAGAGLCELLLRRPTTSGLGERRLAASHPLPRQRGPKQWAFVPCVGVLSRCKPWPCAPASASSRVWRGWPRRPKGQGQPADRDPAFLSLPHRGSQSPERTVWASRSHSAWISGTAWQARILGFLSTVAECPQVPLGPNLRVQH